MNPLQVTGLGGPGGTPFAGPGGGPRRRPALGIAGVLLLLAGVTALVWGVLQLVSSGQEVEDSIVHEMQVALVAPVPSVADLPEGEYTLYAHDTTLNDEVAEQEIRNTSCTVTFSSGGSVSLNGARQGTSATVGDYRSIGWFTSPGGSATVLCERAYDRRFADSRRIVVAEGRPAGDNMTIAIIVVVAGGIAALLSLDLVALGVRGRRLSSAGD